MQSLLKRIFNNIIKKALVFLIFFEKEYNNFKKFFVKIVNFVEKQFAMISILINIFYFYIMLIILYLM